MGKIPFGKYKVKIGHEYDKSKLDALIKEENLNPELTYWFVNLSIRNGCMIYLCMDFPQVLSPISLFDPIYGETKRRVWEKLTAIMCAQDAEGVRS